MVGVYTSSGTSKIEPTGNVRVHVRVVCRNRNWIGLRIHRLAVIIIIRKCGRAQAQPKPNPSPNRQGVFSHCRGGGGFVRCCFDIVRGSGVHFHRYLTHSISCACVCFDHTGDRFRIFPFCTFSTVPRPFLPLGAIVSHFGSSPAAPLSCGRHGGIENVQKRGIRKRRRIRKQLLHFGSFRQIVPFR